MVEYKLLKADDVTTHDYDDGPKCKGATVDLPDRWVACRDCFRYRLVIASCGQRNCGRCQLKRSALEYERYFPALSKIDCGNVGRKWIMVNLTGYRISRDWVGGNAHIMMNDAVQLLQKWFLGGFVVIEHTWHEAEKEYYLHAHGLVIGDYVNNRIQREHGMTDFQMFASEWGRFVGLTSMHFDPKGNPRTNAQTVKAGLSYVLKYVTKGVALNDEELDQVKRLRYIRTFGEIYKCKKPVVVSRCKFCYDGDLGHGRLEMAEDWQISKIITDKMALGPEALETTRVLSWPGKTAIELVEAVKGYFSRIHERFKVLQDRIDREKPFQHAKMLIRWLDGIIDDMGNKVFSKATRHSNSASRKVCRRCNCGILVCSCNQGPLIIGNADI